MASPKTIKHYVMAGLAVTICTSMTYADLTDFSGQFQTELEERAAVSNQQVYDELKASGCQDIDRGPTTSCTATSFIVWRNVRELVHTANDLAGSGPTQFSLGNNLLGLGFALRWTAAEEFSSEESLADSFVSGQLSGLSSRITALRNGSRGFNLAGLPNEQDITGINAGDEKQPGDNWSRLGGFINGSYSYGEQDASGREVAFNFDGDNINGGVDYRINNNWVVGALLGYTKQEIDFDNQFPVSIVEGSVEMDAYSVMPFVLYQSNNWFFSGSLGYQVAEFETERRITYPSANPDLDDVNTTAISDNDADIFSANASVGYSYFVTERLSIEPAFTVNWQTIRIEEYRETDINDDGFDFIVDNQEIDSLETVASITLRYSLTTNLGVFVPYFSFEDYTEHEDDERFIDATYVNVLEEVTDAAKFSLPTDKTEQNYQIFSVGISTVIRGARQTTFGSAASGGIQVYANVRKIEGIDNYEQKIISGGLRYEF